MTKSVFQKHTAKKNLSISKPFEFWDFKMKSYTLDKDFSICLKKLQ